MNPKGIELDQVLTLLQAAEQVEDTAFCQPLLGLSLEHFAADSDNNVVGAATFTDFGQQF